MQFFPASLVNHVFDPDCTSPVAAFGHTLGNTGIVCMPVVGCDQSTMQSKGEQAIRDKLEGRFSPIFAFAGTLPTQPDTW